MHFSVAVVAAVSTANAAFANTLPTATANNQLQFTIESGPRPTAVARLQEREEKLYECINDLVNNLVPDLSHDEPHDEVWKWMEHQTLDACSLTAPLGISSHIPSLLSRVTKWYTTNEVKAEMATICGEKAMTFYPKGCTASHTVFFTDGSDKTVSTVFPPFPLPRDGGWPIGSKAPDVTPRAKPTSVLHLDLVPKGSHVPLMASEGDKPLTGDASNHHRVAGAGIALAALLSVFIML